MKKTKLTRSLLAACSIVALTAVMYGCTHSGDDGVPQTDHDQVQDQVAELTTQINALRAQLGLEADDDLGDSIANLQAELKRLQDELQARMDAEQEQKDKEMAAEARRLAVGLDAEFPGLEDSDAPVVTAMYGKNARVTMDLTGAGAVDPVFMDKNSKSLGMMDGWSGTELTSSMENGPSDVMHVYTNVAAPKSVDFAEWAAATAGVTLDGGRVTVAAGHASHITGDAFASGSGSISHEHNLDTDTSTAGNETFRTSGTFGGASGTYTCTGTCSSAVAGTDGGVTLTGTWHFTPNTGAMARVPDVSYQYFGWWLRKATAGYSVDVFASSMGDAVATLGTVGGTATYTGAASGKYSIYDSGPKGGHFSAEVELKADFEDGTQNGTISGTVDNFSGGDGMDTWEVTLPKLNLNGTGGFAAATPGTPTADEMPVWTIDGSSDLTEDAGTLESEWSGSLYAADDGGTPQVAVGTFTVEHGGIGNMKGAFGADHTGP